ncbi:hypothetical protein OROGR_006234 [Orobanche gracilis]
MYSLQIGFPKRGNVLIVNGNRLSLLGKYVCLLMQSLLFLRSFLYHWMIICTTFGSKNLFLGNQKCWLLTMLAPNYPFEDSGSCDKSSNHSENIDLELCKGNEEEVVNYTDGDCKENSNLHNEDIGGEDGNGDKTVGEEMQVNKEDKYAEKAPSEEEVESNIDGGDTNNVEVTVVCKIPSDDGPEVFPSENELLEAQLNGCDDVGSTDEANPKSSDDIFSLDIIIRQEQMEREKEKSCPPKPLAKSVSTGESSGAPGFIKGVYLDPKDTSGGNTFSISKEKAQHLSSTCTSSGSSVALENAKKIIDVGKEMGYEVEMNTRDLLLK